ncbi:hypothetical protein QTP88_018982 [Uroleucon formosanum]
MIGGSSDLSFPFGRELGHKYRGKKKRENPLFSFLVCRCRYVNIIFFPPPPVGKPFSARPPQSRSIPKYTRTNFFAVTLTSAVTAHTLRTHGSYTVITVGPGRICRRPAISPNSDFQAKHSFHFGGRFGKAQRYV